MSHEAKINKQAVIFERKFMKMTSNIIEEEVGPTKVEYERMCFHRGNSMMILPYDPKTQSVIMVKQIRIGALYDGFQEQILEFPGGMIEEGEKALDTAERELREETGLTAIHMGALYPHPIYTSVGGSNEKMYYFLAEVDASQAKARTGNPKENEYLETVIVPIEELFKMAVDRKTISNAGTLIATLLLKNKLFL